MSITFGIEDTPYKTVPCDICSDCDVRAGRESDPYCTGTRNVPTLPEVNMANGNAFAIMRTIGMPTDEDSYCGAVEPSELPALQRKIIKARSVASARRSAIVEPAEYGGPGTGTCRVIECGRGDDYLQTRLQQLADVVAEAKRLGKALVWG